MVLEEKKIFSLLEIGMMDKVRQKMRKIPLWHKKNISQNFSLLAFIYFFFIKKRKQHKNLFNFNEMENYAVYLLFTFFV